MKNLRAHAARAEIMSKAPKFSRDRAWLEISLHHQTNPFLRFSTMKQKNALMQMQNIATPMATQTRITTTLENTSSHSSIFDQLQKSTIRPHDTIPVFSSILSSVQKYTSLTCYFTTFYHLVDILLEMPIIVSVRANSHRIATRGIKPPNRDSQMIQHQATGRGIRARNQAIIREGGEQERVGDSVRRLKRVSRPVVFLERQPIKC